MEPIIVNKQSSIKITGEKILYFDPLEVLALHDADYIFITHPHWDHFSLLSILEIKKENTVFITVKDIVEELLSIGIREEYIVVVEPNKNYVLKNLEFRTVPAYNTNKNYHPKKNKWVGYVVNYENVIYYITGDTDLLKELKEVKCDVLFVPIGGTYTMDALEASNLTNAIKPKLVIPTHYGSVVGTYDDAKIFQSKLDKGITCKILLRRKDVEK